DRRAGRDVSVDDPDTLDVGAVGRPEVADPVAVGLQAELAVQARDLGIVDRQVGAGAPDHDARLRELDDLADVGARYDLEAASTHVDRARQPRKGGDPGGSLKMVPVDHVFGGAYHGHCLPPRASAIRTRPTEATVSSPGASLVSSISASTTVKLMGGSCAPEMFVTTAQMGRLSPSTASSTRWPSRSSGR